MGFTLSGSYLDWREEIDHSSKGNLDKVLYKNLLTEKIFNNSIRVRKGGPISNIEKGSY